MNEFNIVFLEKYKHLDKLCRDMFGTEQGVTDYINTAKNDTYLQNHNDIRKLIRLRHIRNQLTHDVNTFNVPMCSASDIDWLEDFYQKVFSVSDPLSLRLKSKNTTKNIVYVDKSPQTQAYIPPKNNSFVLPVFLGITLAIITVTLLYFFFFI